MRTSSPTVPLISDRNRGVQTDRRKRSDKITNLTMGEAVRLYMAELIQGGENLNVAKLEVADACLRELELPITREISPQQLEDWANLCELEPELVSTHLPDGYYGPSPRTPKVPEVYRKEKIPEGLRWRVFVRDGFACQHCGSREFLRADHVIPESKGGPTTFENLQTLCNKCNSRKGSRL